jgi:hypothetical protein
VERCGVRSWVIYAQQAPSSTKNEKGERDPEMHQTKKGNQWYFGMKVHIGVDKDTGLISFTARRRWSMPTPATRASRSATRWKARASASGLPCGQESVALYLTRQRGE